ncbi:MAG: RNA 2'-phosphotransferase [Kofleriaceae bacterium]|nr:RNA 2'-phosphotransferase [Kofleriaceae bacterium]
MSKFLSYILRHAPEHVGLVLDSEGWVSIEELLVKCRAAGRAFAFAALRDVVTTSPKQRFAISLDGQRIRANQGHSVAVDFGYPPVVPPAILFHGTYNDALARILVEGLQKMQRHHVHLSADIKTALLRGYEEHRHALRLQLVPQRIAVCAGWLHHHLDRMPGGAYRGDHREQRARLSRLRPTQGC